MGIKSTVTLKVQCRQIEKPYLDLLGVRSYSEAKEWHLFQLQKISDVLSENVKLQDKNAELAEKLHKSQKELERNTKFLNEFRMTTNTPQTAEEVALLELSREDENRLLRPCTRYPG